MLSARKIQEVLNNGTVDEKARLILNEQQLQEVPIASIFPDEIAMGAIACTVWTQYSSATSNEVFFHLIKVDKGYFAIAAVGKSHILAGVGNANPGLFRSRLHTLSQYFGKVFEQLK